SPCESFSCLRNPKSARCLIVFGCGRLTEWSSAVQSAVPLSGQRRVVLTPSASHGCGPGGAGGVPADPVTPGCRAPAGECVDPRAPSGQNHFLLNRSIVRPWPLVNSPPRGAVRRGPRHRGEPEVPALAQLRKEIAE